MKVQIVAAETPEDLQNRLNTILAATDPSDVELQYKGYRKAHKEFGNEYSVLIKYLKQ